MKPQGNLSAFIIATELVLTSHVTGDWEWRNRVVKIFGFRGNVNLHSLYMHSHICNICAVGDVFSDHSYSPMYQETATETTEYDLFLDPTNYMYGDASGTGAPYHTRRSNSRSGYRLFARVAHTGNRPLGNVNSRMPPRESVYNFFSQFGIVLDCYLPESATNVAYLCFEDENTMETVLTLPEHMLCIDGVYVSLSRASPRPDYSMNNTDRVFVKNCPENVNRTDLRNYFSQFGLVTDVYIPKDKVTGEQKKFAFVTFANVETARTAISFGDTHRLIYFDRFTNSLTTVPLQVMPAEPRPTTATGTPLSGPVSVGFIQPTKQTSAHRDSWDDAFTTASSTVATNTPTSTSMSVEAAASVLINALSQLEPRGSPSDEDSIISGCTELDEIIAKLASLSLGADSATGSPLPSPTPSPEESSVLLSQLIEESLSRQPSAELNIFEQFLNPSWESRE
jgi:hypothetical protein